MERMLIVKVKRVDQAGKCELYGKRHRYADLRCDLADLAAVMADPGLLQVGQEQPLMAWATWELSERVNSKGNRYHDLVLLEPLTAPASTTSAAVGDPDILAELRQISGLLQVLVDAQGLQVPPPAAEQEPAGNGDGSDVDELQKFFPRYQDGSPVGDSTAEAEAWYDYRAAHGDQAPANVAELRAWVAAKKQAKGR